MKIETKYDLGQTIYTIRKGSKEIKIDKITEITIWDDGIVTYECQSSNYCNNYDARNYYIFDNEEEAEKKVKKLIDVYINNI